MSARSRRSSSSDRSPSQRTPRRRREPGQRAGAGGLELQSYQVGALPLVNRLLERMRLREILSEHLPADDPRTELATVSAVWVRATAPRSPRVPASHSARVSRSGRQPASPRPSRPPLVEELGQLSVEPRG